jgi:CheY-like chemotaxis protein
MLETTTFLLVEDEPNDVVLVEMEFKRSPFPIRLRAVNDGEEAMHYLEGQGPYADRAAWPIPDVILLDLKMRRVSGFEFLIWLRSKAPSPFRLIPVVVMSSSTLHQDIDHAYALGANSYFVKPVDWNLFRKRIRALGIYWAEHAETPEAGH